LLTSYPMDSLVAQTSVCAPCSGMDTLNECAKERSIGSSSGRRQPPHQILLLLEQPAHFRHGRVCLNTALHIR
jgi:hypothetical protein